MLAFPSQGAVSCRGVALGCGGCDSCLELRTVSIIRIVSISLSFFKAVLWNQKQLILCLNSSCSSYCSVLEATGSPIVLLSFVTSFQVTAVNNLSLCYCGLWAARFYLFFFPRKLAGFLEPSALTASGNHS